MNNADRQRREQLQGAEQVYPALFHFRIIAEAQARSADALRAVVGRFRVFAPLALSRASSGAGRFESYSVSIEMGSRAEMAAFESEVRRVPGVRMVL